MSAICHPDDVIVEVLETDSGQCCAGSGARRCDVRVAGRLPSRRGKAVSETKQRGGVITSGDRKCAAVKCPLVLLSTVGGGHFIMLGRDEKCSV